MAGTLGAVGAWQVLRPEQERGLAMLTEALETRQEAARGALASLDRANQELQAMQDALHAARSEAAERRASELALLASPGPVPPGFSPHDGEQVGRLWPDQDRVAGLGLGSRTSTLSVSHPELWAALGAAPKDARGPLVVRLAGGVYAVGPGLATPGTGRALAFVPVGAKPTSKAGLHEARAALGNLAAPEALAPWVEHPEWGLAVAGLLGAILVFVWSSLRVSRPLLDTLDAARDFIHGDPGARADEGRGGREAREVARAVNGLVERAVRLENQGRAAREEDIQAAAVAIETFGKGDLSALTPRLGPPFVPLSRALDRARRELIVRVERLHEVSRGVAMAACEMAPGARHLETATDAQRQALERLGQGLHEAERQVRDGEDRLRAALQTLSAASLEQGRLTRDLKTTLNAVNRRVTDLGATAARIDSLSTSSAAIEQALSLLGTWAAVGGPAPIEQGRATQLVGEGKAAFSNISVQMRHVQADLRAAAETLAILAAEHVEVPPNPTRTAAQPLIEAASGLVRASELARQGLGGWLRTVRQLGHETGVVASAAEAASGRLSELSDALSDLRVGDAFETALLERLERARAEAEAAGSAGLTPDGALMLAEVEAAAEAAHARVGRLIQATEATLDVLRG